MPRPVLRPVPRPIPRFLARVIAAALLSVTAPVIGQVSAQFGAPGEAAMAVPADGAPVDFGRSLPPLLAWAREKNPDFAAMRFESAAAQARIAQVEALADPMLLTELRDVTREGSGNGGTSGLTLDPSKVGSTRWQVSQALPGWGKRQRKSALASASADEAAYRAAAAWNEVAAQIRSLWSQSWRFQQSIVVTRELRDLLRGVEETARRRYALGAAAQSDVLRAQVELTTLEGELAQMDADLHGQLARLNLLLSRDAEAAILPPETLPALPLVDHARHQQLILRLKESNPARLAEFAKAGAADRNREVVRDARTPDYRVGLGAIQMGRTVAEWELMLEVNIPLQQGSRRAQESEAAAMFDAARARQQAVENQALAELAHAVADYQAARRLETLAAQSFAPQAEVAFQSALAAYENGRLDFATLLDAQRQLRQARLAVIRAHADAQLRLAEIEKAVGEAL